jgi:hypothetical protein
MLVSATPDWQQLHVPLPNMTSIFAQALAGGTNPFAASVSPSPVLPAAPQVVNESAVSEPAAIEPVHPTPVSPEVDEGAKDGYDQKSSK